MISLTKKPKQIEEHCIGSIATRSEFMFHSYFIGSFGLYCIVDFFSLVVFSLAFLFDWFDCYGEKRNDEFREIVAEQSKR